MSVSDSIADFFTRLRNAKDAQHRYVDVKFSNQILSILKLLQGQGFIDKFFRNEENYTVRVYLKYSEGRVPVLQNIIRQSSPGLRRYIGYKKIPRVLGGMGLAILSTPKGILGGEEARQQKCGGELLCLVW
ncbi:MAG: 30S ribosomal protein S8 [Rhabdochlamydiaceae bacterium]